MSSPTDCPIDFWAVRYATTDWSREVGRELPVRLSNARLAKALPGSGLENRDRPGAYDALRAASVAVMTGGLGNVFDAASVRGLPAVWLTPMNDSQGRQLRALEALGLADRFVDWHRFGGEPIDYHTPQPEVLRAIADRVTRLRNDPCFGAAFIRGIGAAVAEVSGSRGKAAGLLDRLGRGGLTAAAREVLNGIRPDK